jgi:thiamine transporter ThiT
VGETRGCLAVFGWWLNRGYKVELENGLLVGLLRLENENERELMVVEIVVRWLAG